MKPWSNQHCPVDPLIVLENTYSEFIVRTELCFTMIVVPEKAAWLFWGTVYYQKCLQQSTKNKQTNKDPTKHTHTKLTSKQQINNKIKQQNQIVKKHNKQTKTKN